MKYVRPLSAGYQNLSFSKNSDNGDIDKKNNKMIKFQLYLPHIYRKKK